MFNKFSKVSFAFLNIGKTKESTEGGTFKRYIGVGSSFVLAVNPNKKQLDELMGYESQAEPEYTGSDDNGQFARINFIVKTDPKTCNGIEMTNRVSFTLRPNPAYNKDKTKVQVIDIYGNHSWTNVDDAKEGKKLLSSTGLPLRIADKYRMAMQGEPELVDFLKAYLNVGDAFNYVNGTWVLKEDAADYVFGLEHLKDYFKGDFSEIKEALALQPNNKVKLLYGIRTNEEGKQYTAIATGDGMVLRNGAGAKGLERLEKLILDAKQAGRYASTEFKVQELAEYVVEPTNFSTAETSEDTTSASDDMPWNM